MSQYQITTKPQAIYPGGYQEDQAIYNIGANTVYLSDSSNPNALASFPLPKNSSIVWDAQKPLYAILAPGTVGIGVIFVLPNKGSGQIGQVYLADGTAIQATLAPGSTVGVTGAVDVSGSSVGVSGNVGVSGPVDVSGSSVGVSGSVGLAPGTAVGVSGAVDVSGSSVAIPNGVAVTSLPPTDWYWPCLTGESYAPTFTTASYSTNGGFPCVKVTTANGTVVWNAAAIKGPNSQRYTVVRCWIRYTGTSSITKFGPSSSGAGGLAFNFSGTQKVGIDGAATTAIDTNWHYYVFQYDWTSGVVKGTIDGAALTNGATGGGSDVFTLKDPLANSINLSSLSIQYRDTAVL